MGDVTVRFATQSSYRRGPNKLKVMKLVKKFESFMEAEFYCRMNRSDDKCCRMYILN
jgi:hypothetical protein